MSQVSYLGAWGTITRQRYLIIAYFKDSDGDHAEFALVHYYDGQRVPHPDLGVLVMSLMQPSLADAYGVVTLENIVGHARMIRDRKTQYYFWDLVDWFPLQKYV